MNARHCALILTRYGTPMALSLAVKVRDLNIEKLGPYLGAKAKIIRGQYDQFRANKDASITEIHDFVKLIPGLKESYASLNQHINITAELKRTTDSAAFRSRWNTERAVLEGDTVYELLEDMIATQVHERASRLPCRRRQPDSKVFLRRPRCSPCFASSASSRSRTAALHRRNLTSFGERSSTRVSYYMTSCRLLGAWPRRSESSAPA